jgi:hypothetical protein
MLRARQWVIAAIVLVYTSAFALPSEAFSQASSADQLQVPAPAAVALDANTTTFLAMFLAIDFLQSTCTPNPSCTSTLPAVSSALATARAAGAHVVYSVLLAPDNNILADVAPAPNDPPQVRPLASPSTGPRPAGALPPARQARSIGPTAPLEQKKLTEPPLWLA